MAVLDDKNDRLSEVPDAFINSSRGLEKDIMKDIESFVSELETENGVIILNESNMANIENVNKRLKNIVFNAEYEKNLITFVNEFGKQAALSNEYFQTLNVGFELTPLYQTILKSSQRNALSLLNEDAFTQVLIGPLKQTLEASITNQVSFSETLANLRFLIEGDKTIDGRLLSHIKRVAYDSFAISDRSYTNLVANNLGLEFYRYSGGGVKDTRCFCLERKGKYFHKKEVEGWGGGKDVGDCGFPWQGMNTSTDRGTIFFYAGGYNCKHHILPVSEALVPKDVIERNKRNGNFKP